MNGLCSFSVAQLVEYLAVFGYLTAVWVSAVVWIHIPGIFKCCGHSPLPPQKNNFFFSIASVSFHCLKQQRKLPLRVNKVLPVWSWPAFSAMSLQAGPHSPQPGTWTILSWATWFLHLLFPLCRRSFLPSYLKEVFLNLQDWVTYLYMLEFLFCSLTFISALAAWGWRLSKASLATFT